MHNKKILLLALLSIVILISGCILKQESSPENVMQPQQQEQIEQQLPAVEENIPSPTQQTPIQQPVQQAQQQSWQLGGLAIGGSYADAEIVELENGNYRMYYSIEPEVPGNKLEVFSSISADGVTWQKEQGTRKEFATFPDIVKLSDGRFRMYFQNVGVIKSATSHDGLIWIDDPGIRIDKIESGFKLEDVGAQGTIRLEDGTYIMVYRGTVNEPYQTAEKIPNKDTHIYFWATSKDGLTFEKKGLAIDSRNDVLLGAADGAEWVRWDQTSSGQVELRIYFWSYAGVYHVVYKDGTFSEPVFDFTNNQDKMAKFPPNPPADPTLAKINGEWFMYYGQHTKGIYYVTLEQQHLSPSAQSSEALNIPPSIENNCIGFKIKSPGETATINLIGAGWATVSYPLFRWGIVEPVQGTYDFHKTDELVKIAQENNVSILAEIQPFANWDQGEDPTCKAKEHEYLCKPKDMQAYKRFLSDTIERYDGDGENDMPGLKIPIKYWEIINEPDIKEAPMVIFFMGNEKDYIEVLKESYQTIKQKCSDCRVLQGAAAGSQPQFLSFWDNVFELGGANYFDIANIHFVGIDIASGNIVSTGDASTLNVKPFKEVLDRHGIKKPIWVTEAVLQSSSAKSSLQGALSAGASKVFFVGFGVEESAPIGEYSAEYKDVVELCPKAS